MSLENHPMWRKPRHHMALDEAHNHVHWVELFYDLIHVVIVFLLGNYLSDHMSLEGFFVFSGLFIAIWFAWADSSVFNSLFVSTDIKHRLIMATQIITAMVMAASITKIHGEGWMFFAFAFAINRAITGYLYHRTKKLGDDEKQLSRQVSRNFFGLSIVFAVSAFLPQPFGYILFGLGIAFIQLLYTLPKIGMLENKRFIPRLEHMSERFALLLLIVVGEGFFKLVLTLSEKGIYKAEPSVLVNFVFGGFSVFVMCWIYFDFVGNGKPKDTKKLTLVNWWLGHLFLMLSAVMIGVALSGEVKVGFLEPYPYGYGVIGCVGLLMYLVCLLWIQFNIEHRVAHRFATTKIRLIGIVLAIVTLLVVPYVPAIVGNLLWGAALYSQIVIPLTRGFITLSREESEILENTKI